MKKGSSRKGGSGSSSNRVKRRAPKKKKGGGGGLMAEIQADLDMAKAEGLEDKVRKEFRKYDKDRSGSIDRSELHALLADLGFSDKDGDKFGLFLDEEFKFHDANSDNQMSFEEFVVYHNKLIDYEKDHEHFNWALDEILDNKGYADARVFHDEVLLMAEAHKAFVRLDVAALKEIAAIDTAAYTRDVAAIFDCMCVILGIPAPSTPDEARALFTADVGELHARIAASRPADLAPQQLADLRERLPKAQGTVMATVGQISTALYELYGFVLCQYFAARKLAAIRAATPEPAEEKEDRSWGALHWDKRKTTEELGYIRVNSVELFDSGTLHRKRDTNAGMPGVKLHMGTLDDGMGKEAVVAVIIDRERISDEDAERWWEKNEGRFPRIRPRSTSPPPTEEKWMYNSFGRFVKQVVVIDPNAPPPPTYGGDIKEGEPELLAKIAEAARQVDEKALWHTLAFAGGGGGGSGSIGGEKEPTAEELPGKVLLLRLLTCFLVLIGTELSLDAAWAEVRAALPPLDAFKAALLQMGAEKLPRHRMLKRCVTAQQFFGDPAFSMDNVAKVGGDTATGLLLWSKRVVDLYKKGSSAGA
eukprot:g3572.t1